MSHRMTQRINEPTAHVMTSSEVDVGGGDVTSVVVWSVEDVVGRPLGRCTRCASANTDLAICFPHYPLRRRRDEKIFFLRLFNKL